MFGLTITLVYCFCYMKYFKNLIFFVQQEFISQYYNKLGVSVKLNKGSNIDKTEKHFINGQTFTLRSRL